MKTPQVAALPGMTPLGLTNKLSADQAEMARRQAAKPLIARKPQLPCDHGLFGDDALQADMCEIFGAD